MRGSRKEDQRGEEKGGGGLERGMVYGKKKWESGEELYIFGRRRG
jgi:hypothetical protein